MSYIEYEREEYYTEIKNKDKIGCGICSIGPNGLIKAGDEGADIYALKQDGTDKTYYENLVKSYSSKDAVPGIERIKRTLQPGGPPNSFKPLVPISVGGKSRRKNKRSNKTKRKSKRSKIVCGYCRKGKRCC